VVGGGDLNPELRPLAFVPIWLTPHLGGKVTMVLSTRGLDLYF
jgi:hypothetical protein